MTACTGSVDAEAEEEAKEETTEDSSVLEGFDDILDSAMDEEREAESVGVGIAHDDKDSIPRTRQTLVNRVRNKFKIVFRISMQTSILNSKTAFIASGESLAYKNQTDSVLILHLPSVNINYRVFCRGSS